MKSKHTPFVWIGILIVAIFLPRFHPAFFPLTGCTTSTPENKKLIGEIHISGAFALYPLTVRWANEFMKDHPDVSIIVEANGTGAGMAEVLSGKVDLAMLSRDIHKAESEQGIWKIGVARDAVFPTINYHNPIYIQVAQKGLTREQLQVLFQRKTENWGQFLKDGSAIPLHLYNRSDSCGAAEIWSAYLGVTPESLAGTKVYGDPGMADALSKDHLGIGYINLAYLYDLETREQVNCITVLPIDLNGNRMIDPEEKLYGSLDKVLAVIQSGDYPSPPARNLYLVSKEKPKSEVVNAFINYIQHEGQAIVPLAGYVCFTSDSTR